MTGQALTGLGMKANSGCSKMIRPTEDENKTGTENRVVFLPFYTTKEVGKGTGLGLSVSSSIVESFGGRIEVQSMLGAGSSFTVVLPVNQPETVENE